MNTTAVISIGSAVLPAVPTDAIVTYQGQDYIFAQTKEEVPHHEEDETRGDKAEQHKEELTVNFERVQVIKGATDVGYSEITFVKNIPSNTKVVVKGAFFVLAKMINVGEEE